MSIIALASNTLSSPASAGQIEYNGTIFVATPTSTQRGIVPTEQFYSLNSGLAGANATGAQNSLGVGVTIAGSTIYEFEMQIALAKTAGTTAHTIALGFGGTATINNIFYISYNIQNNATLPNVVTSSQVSTAVNNTASSTVMTSSLTSANQFFTHLIKGIVSINAGGTFIPQYTLSAAPGGAYTTQTGSYMKIKPIGASGSNVNVGTWA